MSRITITLPADRMHRLHELALQHNVTPEDIVRIGYELLLKQPQEDVEQLVERMRKTQPDIFRRLA